MRKLIHRTVLLLIGGAIASITSAFAAPYQRDPGREYQTDNSAITILFINGVLNDESQVERSSDRLILSLSGLPQRTYNFDYFHNPTDGIPGDSGEVLEQIKISDTYLTLSGNDKTTYYTLLGNYYNLQAANTLNLSPARRRIVSVAARLAENFRQILTTSAGLVVVPHSQGNLLVEAAYAMLLAKGESNLVAKIRVVGVAPASATTPSGRYVSHDVDEMITVLEKNLAALHSLSAFSPLPSNTTACTGEPVQCAGQIDWVPIEDPPIDLLPTTYRLKHSFVQVYLNAQLKNAGTDDTFPKLIYKHVINSLQELGGALPGVVYVENRTDEAIQLGSPTPGSFRYYFLDYQTAGNPPAQPGYWIATRSFDTVRIRLLGGTGTCQDLGPSFASSSRLVDETGQTLATLVSDVFASGSGHCVFRTIRGGGLTPIVPAGSRIAAVELFAGLLSTKNFTLGGSRQNSGKSLFGFASEQAGGFAFQFCAGLCDQPFGAPGGTAPTVSSATCTAPIVGQDMTCTVTGTNLPATSNFTASNCSPSPMTAVAGGTGNQRQFTCTPVTAGLLVQVSYTVPEFIGPLPPLAATVATLPPPPPPPSAQLNDTGITNTLCNQPGSDLFVSCASAEALALSALQDGMTGRDSTDGGGSDGAKGFSFSGVSKSTGDFYSRTECIKDNVTGLIWEGKTSDNGQRDFRRTYSNWQDGRADDSSSYVNYVNSIALCGLSDWRLPSAHELFSIVDLGRYWPNPAIDTEWFVNFPPGSSGTGEWIYWTGDVVSGATSLGHFVYFFRGAIYQPRPLDLLLRIRLVRGNQFRNRYEPMVGGTLVRDIATGLVWRRCAEGMAFVLDQCVGTPQYMSHEQALAYAKSQPGRWRVPNIKELNSIADYSRTTGSMIDSSYFPNTPLTLFISATPSWNPFSFMPTVASQAYFVDFSNGRLDSNIPRDGVAFLVRLVQDF